MEYRVLARKYRPTNFDDLIGQEVLVRTLSNAIASNRVAHAFLLTGIRGIGKTTTARIIARALNCEQGPTISPCGVCSQCVSISEDRNMDVLEMDAASHTGVDAMRDLIDSVRYLPNAARYKIIIVDEVHMLSNSAFNALLKTLEEPPSHVKFIFATTEVRKIPVTILSRCQRFDLKRITTEMLAAHLAKICGKEAVSADDEALTLISLAAEGSVRDALSLLDQAIARGQDQVNASDVRQMLGSSDNTAGFTLLRHLLAGEVEQALTQLRASYNAGADPLLIAQDTLELVHLITRVKINPAAANDVALSQYDREQSLALATALSMPVLTRLWQMLLKGISELRMASSPIAALEMLCVRVAYAADLPTPAEAIRSGETFQAKPALEIVSTPKTEIKDFPALVKLFETEREHLLHLTLKDHASLVAFEQGMLTIAMTTQPARDFTSKLADCLSRWTGQPWKIVLSDAPGAETLYAQENAYAEKQKTDAASHPLVASVLDQFPGAKIVGVKE